MRPYRLSQRSGSPYWWYSFTVNGVRFRGSTKTSEKAKANELALKLYTSVFDGSYLNKKTRITVEYALTKYYKEEGCFRKSEATIFSHLRKFKEFFGSTTYWDLLDDNFIGRYVTQRRNSYVNVVKNYKNKPKELVKTDRKVSNSTINREIEVLSRINYLCKEVWGYESAKFNIRKHKLEKGESRTSFFTMEMAQNIAKHLPTPHKWAFLLACYTGVRRNNALKLKREQIDREGGQIEFRVKSRKPGGKIVLAPIISPLENMFKEMESNGISFKGKGYLFTYPKGLHKGKPLGDIRKVLYTAYEKAGYERKFGEGFHLTRHSLATWLINNGLDMELAQQILGHSNISMTQVYAHRNTDAKKDALEKILTQNWHNDGSNEDS